MAATDACTPVTERRIQQCNCPPPLTSAAGSPLAHTAVTSISPANLRRRNSLRGGRAVGSAGWVWERLGCSTSPAAFTQQHPTQQQHHRCLHTARPAPRSLVYKGNLRAAVGSHFEAAGCSGCGPALPCLLRPLELVISLECTARQRQPQLPVKGGGGVLPCRRCRSAVGCRSTCSCCSPARGGWGREGQLAAPQTAGSARGGKGERAGKHPAA